MATIQRKPGPASATKARPKSRSKPKTVKQTSKNKQPQPKPQQSTTSKFMSSKLFKVLYGFDFDREFDLKCLLPFERMLERHSNLDINIRRNDSHLVDLDVYHLTKMFHASEAEKIPLDLIKSEKPEYLKPMQPKARARKITVKHKPKPAHPKQTRAPAQQPKKKQLTEAPRGLKRKQTTTKSKERPDETIEAELKTVKKMKTDPKKSPLFEEDILLPCRAYRDPEIDEAIKSRNKPIEPIKVVHEIIPKRDKPGTAGSKQALTANKSKSERSSRKLSTRYRMANFIDTRGILDSTMMMSLDEFSQRFGIEKVCEDPLQLCKNFSINIPLYEE